MAALAQADRERLIRLLGMLGSSFDGERANAAALADRLVRERGLTWEQVLNASSPPPPPPPHNAHNAWQRPRPRTWRDVRTEIEELEDVLTPWEREFIANIQRWNGALTERQSTKLYDIAERLGIAWY